MRALWTLAVGVLGLDAVLLALAAWWGGRAAHLVGAVVCAVAAAAVALSWRPFRRRLEQLRREVEAVWRRS